MKREQLNVWAPKKRDSLTDKLDRDRTAINSNKTISHSFYKIHHVKSLAMRACAFWCCLERVLLRGPLIDQF